MTLQPDQGRLDVFAQTRASIVPPASYVGSKDAVVFKFAFDKFFALLAILIFSPLMLGIAAALLIIDRQSPFFCQLRIGENGQLFRCWKFQSMVKDADKKLASILANDPVLRAEWDETFKLQNDPRITAFGGFLRKTSLDELPQFWNVLKGEMSLVGPRPIVPAEVERYGSRYWAYACVRPGITGIWQVQGRSDTTYPERVAMDVDYANNRSFWGDIDILLRTVKVVLFRVGAY